PKVQAIGDFGDGDIIVEQFDWEGDLALPPPVSQTERLMTLARLVMERDRKYALEQNFAAALSAARELARLLDSLFLEEIPLEKIQTIDVGQHAEHWAHSLRFLEVIVEMWPRYLRAAKRSDPTQRKVFLVKAQADRLLRTRPQTPVILAGSTGAAPSTARLMQAVITLPSGAGVLPGLDVETIHSDDTPLEDSHAQSGMAALLRRLNLTANSVRPWPGSGTRSHRNNFLATALLPAQATDGWLTKLHDFHAERGFVSDALDGLVIVETENEEDEATAISIELRRALEIPDKSVLLVTPDRNLTRRVALKMRRWGVYIDDSAGIPLQNSLCGTFLLLAEAWLRESDDMVLLLSLLDHPLFGAGLSGPQRMNAISAIDISARGTPPLGGLEGLKTRLRAAREPSGDALLMIERLQNSALSNAHDPFASLSERIRRHIEIAQELADDGLEGGHDRLWSEEGGRDCNSALSDAVEALDQTPDCGSQHYAEILFAIISSFSIRQTTPSYPQIQILGPLEARLQNADHIILAGLNEGVWPGAAEEGAFLSRSMRRQIGLPSPEKKIGLAAHDFAQLAANRQVTLIRAKRSEGAPSKPSRWLVRIKNILEGLQSSNQTDVSASVNTVVELLDRPAAIETASRPNVRLPASLRPRQLPVTAVELWLRDPYSIYAKYVLRLRKLDPLNSPFGQREIGRLLHEVFFQAAKTPTTLTPDILGEIFAENAMNFGFNEHEYPLWKHALLHSFEWFCDFQNERQKYGEAAILEETGSAQFSTTPDFTLTARADRIDLLFSGGVVILDYKTGTIPSEKQGDTFSPQLALTGAIINAGGFEKLPTWNVESYEYIKILNRKPDDNKNGWGRSGADASLSIADAQRRLVELLQAYNSPNAVYHSQPRPEFLNRFGDYDQLARRREWETAGEAEGS
ncbi:MAG: double-strand break repair protein AddB, partial [Parvularculaceae bacterium]|nr:double-strand break repair protein AddB [Parvularculaceae bacterium]